ncbi:MAG TPA: hypothetical protein VK041_02955, partial [Opitutales bacterium]|nr:hypothetical protein [Opitutales bacterium]
LGSAQISRAGEILQSLPEDVAEAARDPRQAVAVIYALLLADDPAIREKQLEIIHKRENETSVARLKTLLPQIQPLAQELRLPLLDLTLPSLKQLSADQYYNLIETIEKLSDCDEDFSIFEFALVKVLQRNLKPHFQKKKQRPTVHYYAAAGLSPEISVLLSALAHCSDVDPQRAFKAGRAYFPNLSLNLIPEKASALKQVDAALDKFDTTSFPVKREFLASALAVIASDGVINPTEAELFRAIAASLDCPMPPIAQPAKV